MSELRENTERLGQLTEASMFLAEAGETVRKQKALLDWLIGWHTFGTGLHCITLCAPTETAGFQARITIDSREFRGFAGSYGAAIDCLVREVEQATVAKPG